MPLKTEVLRHRARMYNNIRAFFDALAYLEVDTPLLASSTNTDCHIQSIRATACQRPLYLQTSPEFAMKRLLAAGSGSIYQICHAFRDEEKGRNHHIEFTLLEWYSIGFNYVRLMKQMEQLINALFASEQSFRRTSYFDCFKTELKLDLATARLGDLRQCVSQYIEGIDVQKLQRDDCLDVLMSQVISRQFSGFTFVYDYPAAQASLAKIKSDNPLVAERFELFYNDLELANGFTELTDALEQRKRFELDNLKRQSLGFESYAIDEDFLQALEQGMPESAGVALGLDRLMMVMLKLDSINDVLALESLR